jgi:uncharacterized protein
MSIQSELRQELKDAMLKRDQPRMDVIRQVETELAVARTAPGFKGEVDDALYLQVIAAYVKKMDKAQKEYEGYGEKGKKMAEQLAFETRYLSRWLPQKLGAAETLALVQHAKAELGLTDPKQAGKLVGHLMKSYKNELDAALVNRLAKEALGGS